jgi:ketosteroid isomerase-like protein
MERSEELRDVIRSTFEAYSAGDASFIDRHTSSQDGVRLIGSDPTEWWEGEQAAEVLKQEMQEGSVRVSPMGDIAAFVEGTVGWVSSRPVWTLEDGREIPTRWTAVFHQEEGEWKVV